MKKIDFRKIMPHLIAVAIFLIVAVIYCKPALEGKVVLQRDIQGWRGMSQQSVEFNDKHGYYPLWTNSMFSGMPAYQIAFDPRTKIQLGYLNPVLTLGLPNPVNFFFLACICFYFFCLVAGANPWVSIMGGLTYAYCTFDPIIIAVGHNTQMISIGYAPAVLAGLLLLFKKRYWSGFAVTAFFAASLIGQSHVQIVYYTLLMAGIMTIAFLVKSYKENRVVASVKSVGLALLAGVLGLASNAVSMMPTYEYAKESTRGGRSELTLDKDTATKTKGGLDKEEAFRWSYGLGETFTFVVPGLYGGGSAGRAYSSSSKFVEKLGEAGVPEDTAIQYGNAYSYWGDQPSTAGPVYIGAIVCFLFLFGLIYVKSWHKWWVVAASALAILLAWGANLKGINYFIFDHLPLYNKFRAVTMSLVIPQFCFSFLAVLAVNQLINETNFGEAWKKLRLAVIVTGAVLLILCGFYFTAGFTSPNDKELKENFKQGMLKQAPGQQPSAQLLQQADDFGRQIITALHTDRKDLMGADLLKSILLIALACVLIGLFMKGKVKPAILIAGLIVLSSYDLLSVDSRYLNTDSFVEDSDFESVFTPTEADQQILKDPDHANFRVFDQTAGNPFYSDSRTSYHHNSIGGYHPALLGLYNDLIENQLSKGNQRVYNMLNTKYFIIQNPQTGKPVAQINPGASGNTWLVKGIKYVDNADAEMDALDSTDLKDTAVVEKRYQAQVKQLPVPDSLAFIKLKENLNDQINYTFQSATPQFAVFSEVYYPAGWNAFIDGKKADYVKVNYVLRGMSIPAGKHDIEFRFEPKSFSTGRTITIWSNIIIILSIIGAIVISARKKNKPDAHVL